jgi:hypothetical protein
MKLKAIFLGWLVAIATGTVIVVITQLGINFSDPMPAGFRSGHLPTFFTSAWFDLLIAIAFLGVAALGAYITAISASDHEIRNTRVLGLLLALTVILVACVYGTGITTWDEFLFLIAIVPLTTFVGYIRHRRQSSGDSLSAA